MTEHGPLPEDRPDTREDQTKPILPLLITGAVLVGSGIGVGLWAWSGGSHNSQDSEWAASCAIIEDESPKVATMQTGPSPTLEDKVNAMRRGVTMWQNLAEQLPDGQFHQLVIDVAETTGRGADAFDQHDATAIIAETRQVQKQTARMYRLLDQHCERWIGPGQWGESGSTPTGSTNPPEPLALPSADCAILESAQPKLEGLMTRPSATLEEKISTIRRGAAQLHHLAEQMPDGQLRRLILERAATADSAADAIEERDMAAMMRAMREVRNQVGDMNDLLDQHCERWIGPGQWGEPGSTPTGPTRPPETPDLAE